MKKIILPLGAVAIILITVFVTRYYCKKNEETGKIETNTKADSSLAVEFDDITVPEAKAMVTSYNPGTIPRPSASGGVMTPVSNTRCVWFDIKSMATLIGQIVKEHGSGVRIYLGTYSKGTTGYDSGGNAIDYSNLNTVVFVSTKDSIGIDNITYHSDYYKPLAHSLYKNSFLVANPMNKGELCPPPAGCNTIGAYLLAP